MKKNFIKALAGVVIFSAFFTACSKDPVTPHEEHNHDDPSKVIMTFIKGHYHGTSFHAIDSTVVATRFDGKFIDPKTNALLVNPPTVTLSDDQLQKLKIVFLAADGDTLNGEFIEEANIHQFFFLPKTSENVLSYEYKDNNLGFNGDFQVLLAGKTFDMAIVLMHGLNKTPQKMWNDVNYNKYGGSVDFSTTLKINTVTGNGDTGH